MNINGVELHEFEAQSLRCAITNTLHSWRINARMAFTEDYERLAKARVESLERIEKIITEEPKCTATTAEE